MPPPSLSPFSKGPGIAAANLHAFNYGLRGETDPAVFKKIADSVLVPEFTPRSGVKIQVNENEPVANEAGGSTSCDTPFILCILTPVDFQAPVRWATC